MAKKNLADALFERKVFRKKFLELFFRMIGTGEELITLLRQCEPRLFESIRVPADELIEQWQKNLQEIMFLVFGGETKKFKKKNLN